MEQIPKAGLSSDWSLQLDSMKMELLVMASQQHCREYVPGSCTHRPSSHGSWFHPKSLTQPQGGRRLRWGWWLGLSRNKVALPEGGAGSPPLRTSGNTLYAYCYPGWGKLSCLVHYSVYTVKGLVSSYLGDLAQLVEHLICIQRVRRSSRLVSKAKRWSIKNTFSLAVIAQLVRARHW